MYEESFTNHFARSPSKIESLVLSVPEKKERPSGLFRDLALARVYGCALPKKQIKEAISRGKKPSYWTRLDVGIWYPINLFKEHAPLIGAGLALNHLTDMSNGEIPGLFVFGVATLWNICRAYSAFVHDYPLPAIGLFSTPVTLIHHRKEIKNDFTKGYNSLVKYLENLE